MGRTFSLKGLAAGYALGAGVMLVAYFALDAANAAQAADEIDANAIYFSWWYVAGTMLAFFLKIYEGLFKHEPQRRFKWRKLAKILIFSIPFLLINVFFFMPKFGPTTGNWQKDLLYAFLTSYATIGIGSAIEDFRRWLDYRIAEPDEGDAGKT